MKKITGAGRKSSILAAGVSCITAIVFCIYGAVYDYFDTGVLIAALLAAVFGVLYAQKDGAATAMLNLLGVVSLGIGFGVFFLNSYYVWADRLNHIEMYGSRGTLVPVVAIMVLFILAMVLFIISCFAGKEEKK